MSQIDTRALIGQLRYEAEGEDALSTLCGCAAAEIERLTRERDRYKAALQSIIGEALLHQAIARDALEQSGTK